MRPGDCLIFLKSGIHLQFITAGQASLTYKDFSMTAQSGNNFENAFSFGDIKPLPRRLYINFDAYTDGDHEFKRELGTQIIGNIHEFRQSLITAIRDHAPQVFLKTCHKIKFTLDLLNDSEFNSIIRELEEDIRNAVHGTNLTGRSKHFEDICNAIIRSLSLEINGVDTRSV
jgi:hypothetical protein